MGGGSRPPDRVCVFHHRTNEPLVRRTLSDGQTTSTKDRALHPQSLCSLPSDLIYVVRPGRLCREVHPTTPCSIGTITGCTCRCFWMRLAVLTKNTAVLFETSMVILESCNQSSSLLSCLHAAYEQRRPVGRSCDVCVIRDERQLDMVERCWHVVHAQAEKARGGGGGGGKSTPNHFSPHATTSQHSCKLCRKFSSYLTENTAHIDYEDWSVNED
jgi:hypothetical protein